MPTKGLPKKVELTTAELKDLHRGQLDTIEQQFSRLLDNHKNGVASSEARRVIYDAERERQFRRGFALEGLEDYQELSMLDQSVRGSGRRKSLTHPKYNPIISQALHLEQETQSARKNRYNSVNLEAGLGQPAKRLNQSQVISYRKVESSMSIMNKKDAARRSAPMEAAFQWQQRQELMKNQTGKKREFVVQELIDEELEDGQNTSIDIFKLKTNYF